MKSTNRKPRHRTRRRNILAKMCASALVAVILAFTSLLAVSGAAAAAYPLTPDNVLQGTGSVQGNWIEQEFGSATKDLARNAADVQFRRDSETYYTIRCTPDGGVTRYQKDWYLHGTIYVGDVTPPKSPVTVDSRKVPGDFTLNGWGDECLKHSTDQAQPYALPENGDPVAFMPGSTFFKDVTFQDQHAWMVAEFNGVDSAVLGKYPAGW